MWKRKAIVSALGLALSLGAAGSAFAADATADGTAGAGTKQVVAAQASAWRSETAALKKQLMSLRAQQKELIAQIRKLRTSNKATFKGLTKEEKKALQAQLSGLAKQIKAQHDAIASERAQKQAQWAQLKAAKKAGDSDAGVAALEEIVSLKEQIIEAQQEILNLQLELQSALNGANA